MNEKKTFWFIFKKNPNKDPKSKHQPKKNRPQKKLPFT